MPRRSTVSSTRPVRRQSSARMASPRRSLTSKPARTVASEATGDGPEYRYGGAGALGRALSSGGRGGEARRGGEGFEKPPARPMLLVGWGGGGVGGVAVGAGGLRGRG